MSGEAWREMLTACVVILVFATVVAVIGAVGP